MKPTQRTFGEQVSSARAQRGWSRARFSKEIGISENSVARYEKAGIDENGQFPPANKLASLCFSLKLNPRDVLLGCLSEEEFSVFAEDEEDIFGFPLYRTLAEESVVYAHDNLKLRAMVRMFLMEKEGKVKLSEDDIAIIEKDFYNISKRIDVDNDNTFYVDDERDDEDLENIILKNGSE